MLKVMLEVILEVTPLVILVIRIQDDPVATCETQTKHVESLCKSAEHVESLCKSAEHVESLCKSIQHVESLCNMWKACVNLCM